MGRVLLSLLLIASQDAPLDRVMLAMRAALAPATQQFPETDETGASPRGGNTEALWMVRPPQDGERTIEILANPLNEANQLKANRAMAQIERNIEAAQRRAAAQYEAAVAEAKRTGKSQEVDGVTLSDEGIAGARIDAESHVSIDVFVNQPSYKFITTSSVPPQTNAMKVPAFVVSVPVNTYKDDRGERFVEAETFVFLGNFDAPATAETADHSYEVTASPKPSSAPVSSIVVRMKGNDALMADLLRKMEWKALLELLK